MHWKAVLTGDIVRSTLLNAERRKALYEVFPVLSQLLEARYPEAVPYDISNFRGDGWQLVLDQPQKAVEISLFIRTYLRFIFSKEKLDTRIAIGVGATNFIPPENVSAGDGPSYTLSGRLLESLSSSRMGIDIDIADKESNLIFLGVQNSFSLMDRNITAWSPSQCQAVYWALQHYRQTEIAKKWQPKAISQASVSYNLKNAGWDQLSLNLLYFENAIGSFLDHPVKGDK
jgi:hypothetical protein